MYLSLLNKIAICQLCILGLSACTKETDTATKLASNLEMAEGMIDAFYSFDPIKLQTFLHEAENTKAHILAYQSWAEGGNYIVLTRFPCRSQTLNTINCSITVQDDLVVALRSGFNVTDTFHLTFEDGVIKRVKTSSNDQPIYFEANDWVEANLPKEVEVPCKREGGVRKTPGDCARFMTYGYKKFMETKETEAASNL